MQQQVKEILRYIYIPRYETKDEKREPLTSINLPTWQIPRRGASFWCSHSPTCYSSCHVIISTWQPLSAQCCTWNAFPSTSAPMFRCRWRELRIATLYFPTQIATGVWYRWHCGRYVRVVPASTEFPLEGPG